MWNSTGGRVLYISGGVGKVNAVRVQRGTAPAPSTILSREVLYEPIGTYSMRQRLKGTEQRTCLRARALSDWLDSLSGWRFAQNFETASIEAFVEVVELRLRFSRCPAGGHALWSR